MRQKLITLCPNSFELAKEKRNFSKWVRLKLINEDFEEDNYNDLADKVQELREACRNWANRYYDVLEKHNLIMPGFENTPKVKE
jgi:hypothetical protein